MLHGLIGAGSLQDTTAQGGSLKVRRNLLREHGRKGHSKGKCVVPRKTRVCLQNFKTFRVTGL